MTPGNSTALAQLSQLEAVVVGVARNCAKTIRKDIVRLQNATSIFSKTYFYIVESDSTDETVATLEKLVNDIAEFRYVSLGRIRDKFQKRTERIAVCRNRYLNEITSNERYSSVSYVVIADLDGLNTRINKSALLSCWAPSTPDWDVCTANQLDFYYDIFALRHPVWCPLDSLEVCRKLTPIIGEEQAQEVAIYSKMVHINTANEWIQVDSAFGGFAIYKFQAATCGRYIGLYDNGEELCEHVAFHHALREKGFTIFINPKLINAATTEHSKGKHFRVLEKVKKRWLKKFFAFRKRTLLLLLGSDEAVHKFKKTFWTKS